MVCGVERCNIEREGGRYRRCVRVCAPTEKCRGLNVRRINRLRIETGTEQGTNMIEKERDSMEKSLVTARYGSPGSAGMMRVQVRQDDEVGRRCKQERRRGRGSTAMEDGRTDRTKLVRHESSKVSGSIGGGGLARADVADPGRYNERMYRQRAAAS